MSNNDYKIFIACAFASVLLILLVAINERHSLTLDSRLAEEGRISMKYLQYEPGDINKSRMSMEMFGVVSRSGFFKPIVVDLKGANPEWVFMPEHKDADDNGMIQVLDMREQLPTTRLMSVFEYEELYAKWEHYQGGEYSKCPLLWRPNK